MYTSLVGAAAPCIHHGSLFDTSHLDRSAAELAPPPPRPPPAPPVVQTAPTLIIEAPEVLRAFRVPTDRLGLDAARGRLGGKLAWSDPRPALIALVASWCAPCAAELPELVALAVRQDLRLVLVSLDDVAGPESLVAVIEDLFARAEPTSRELPALELRADPEGAWTDATAPLLVERGDPGALPQSLLMSPEGVLLALVQGGLDDDVSPRLEAHLAGRAREVCP